MEVAALVASDDGEVPPQWSLLWGFWWGLWGLWLVLAAACFFYAYRGGTPRRGCKLGEDRGTPRGDDDVFCGWVFPGGGCES